MTDLWPAPATSLPLALRQPVQRFGQLHGLFSGGFKRDRAPRFLPSGRLVCAWSEGKRQGIDTLDPEGRSRETLAEGASLYRKLAPSPDGRFLLATPGYDMGFHPLAALLGAPRDELRLLDAHGRELVVLEPLARSGDWAR